MISRAKEIHPSDVSYLRDRFSESAKSSWAYFIPFLTSYNLPPRRRILLVDYLGSTLVLQHSRRESKERFDLVLPPCPLAENAFQAIEGMLQNSSQEVLRMLWVDKEDASALQSKFGLRLTLHLKDREYLYDPKSVSRLQGRAYRDIRKKINSVKRLSPNFRRMKMSDALRARSLHERWRTLQGRSRDFLEDWGYTKAAINNFHLFNESDIDAWCVEIGRDLVAFALAGPIDEKTACFFVAKSDIQINGLSEYLRWKVYAQLSNYMVVNDAGDLGIEGLEQYKRKFRPIGFNSVYTARLDRKGIPGFSDR